MSRKLQAKARKRRAAESGIRSSPWGGRLTVALVYPNTYHHAMSNLGFQTVYYLLNSRDDTLCERFFLPDHEDLEEHKKTGTPIFSLESGRSLTDFDLVAFSLSFENDYLNLPVIFELGRIPWLSRDRGDSFPLLLAGGVCAFMNPEPLAEVIDLFAIGEAEAILPGLVTALFSQGSGKNVLSDLCRLPGIYIPSLYQPTYDTAGCLTGWAVSENAPLPVGRVWAADLEQNASRNFVQTTATEFGDMALTEISRGCSRGCRFCAAGFLFLPPRTRSLESLKSQIDAGLCWQDKQGLVSPAVGDHPELAKIEQYILDHGGAVSVASLRLDAITTADIEALKVSGHKTVTLAPEAGSEKLRKVINKGVTEEQILEAVKRIAGAGIPNLKLYFLIGLPLEEENDITAIIDLTAAIRTVWIEAGKKRGWLGSIHLSINPFVPKPFTPFQWAPMATEAELKKKIKAIRSAIGRLPNVVVSFESPREAILQALLSRGDRRLAGLIKRIASGEKYKKVCRESGIDYESLLHQERTQNENFPWDLLDSRVQKKYLWREYQSAKAETTTPRCVAGCVRCGVCSKSEG
ncbi:MAG: radical SAM protein [Desulfuromonas sp.]|nr:MAG: radical SAM protein [Desulfuromonas sp.]